MAHPAPFAVAMISGDTLMGTRLAQGVASEFRNSSPQISQIAERLAQRYVEMRQGELEHQILSPRGLSLMGFYGAHQSLNPQVVMMLDQTMAQFNLGIELLVTGVDDSGAHIYSVHNPGQPEREHDVIGYAAIGSGGIHALQAMIGFRHSSAASLRETVFRVYASKRQAEVAPGVGLDTDMAVVSASGVRFVSVDTLKKLEKLYDSYGRAAEKAQLNGLEKLSLDEDRREGDDGTESNG